MKYNTNSLYYYADQYSRLITKEEDILKEDMTPVLYGEIEEMIKNGEIIIININSKMRLGKSTVAIALAAHIFELLKKYRQQPKNAKFGMANIARDQQEYSQIMRNPEVNHTVVVTDEDNELENTGENITAERSLLKVFSDVQAGRYVHRVCCSPKETADPNADILLSIISIDKQTRTTHCRIFYRYYEGGQEKTVLVGHVNIPVGNVIKNWEKIKKKFYKKDRTQQEEQQIQEMRKKDYYIEYMIKKYEKMELITKEGIFRPRILEYSGAIVNTIEKLRPLARLTSVINKNIVKNYIKIEFRKQKIPMSILGEELATNETMGILDLYKAKYKLEKDISNEKYPEAKKRLQDTLYTINEAIVIQTDEIKHYNEINEKYHKVIS